MIYLTGDTHGPQDFDRIRPENLISWGMDCQPEDILIVCGDFGIPWTDPAQGPDREMLEEIARWPYTVAFVDGNHENFALLNQYPVVAWKGGKAHQLLPNLFHLMRGELFTLEDCTFFTMGGAMSTDRWMRREGISWWPEEIPSEAEWQHSWDILERAGWRVDYVVTHTHGPHPLENPGRYADGGPHGRQMPGGPEVGRAGKPSHLSPMVLRPSP